MDQNQRSKTLIQIVIIETTESIRLTLLRTMDRQIPGARVNIMWSLSDALNDRIRFERATVVVLGVHINDRRANVDDACRLITSINSRAKLILFAPCRFQPGNRRKICRPNARELTNALGAIVREQQPATIGEERT